MSDNETVDVEVITPSVEDLINSISGEQALDVSQIFDDLMSSKVSDALEAEKIRVAGEVFNGVSGEEDDDVSEEEVDAALAELETMEEEEGEEPVAEVEEPVAEVEEPVAEVEEPVAEVGADEEHEEVEDDLGLYGDEEAAADVDSILSDEELPETED